jgi:hypothetical protein
LTLRVNQSLAKTAASVNYPSARLPRLTQIDAPFSSRLSRDSRLRRADRAKTARHDLVVHCDVCDGSIALVSPIDTLNGAGRGDDAAAAFRQSDGPMRVDRNQI